MKILFGTDGSTFAQLAETLIPKVVPEGSSVTVVMACPPPNLMMTALEPVAPFAAAQQATTVWDECKATAGDICRAASERLSNRGMKVESVVLEGDPEVAIRTYAEEQDFDLVAVGSHGSSGLMDFIMGSVAKSLAHDCACSVLIARTRPDVEPDEAADRLREKDKLTVVLGYDGAEGSEAALTKLKSMGTCCARIVVVVAEPVAALPAGIDPEMYARTVGYERDRGDQLAQGAAEKLSGVAPEVTWETGLGEAAKVLHDKALEHAADLIVMGATSHGRLERFLLGSVSSEVVGSAPCSVLIVRYEA